MPSLPASPLPAEPPADWRERLLDTLASDGISEPPYVPVWRLALINYLKAFAWILLAFLLTYGIPAAAGQLMTEAAFEWVLPFWLIGVAIVLFRFVWPHAQNAVRQFKMELAGRNPSHAVMKAHRPPIFYLRSFAFDQTASAAPKWLQRLLTVGSGAAAASGDEPGPAAAPLRPGAGDRSSGRIPSAAGCDALLCHRCALGGHGEIDRALLRSGGLGERQYTGPGLGNRTANQELAAAAFVALAARAY